MNPHEQRSGYRFNSCYPHQQQNRIAAKDSAVMRFFYIFNVFEIFRKMLKIDKKCPIFTTICHEFYHDFDLRKH